MNNWYKLAQAESLWKKPLGKKDGVDIYSVDGNYVRNNYDVEFCLGGHKYRYDFIPENEVWIEDLKNKEDMQCNLLHELVERKDMKKNGTDYEDAHSNASDIEEEKRKGKKKSRGN